MRVCVGGLMGCDGTTALVCVTSTHLKVVVETRLKQAGGLEAATITSSVLSLQPGFCGPR